MKLLSYQLNGADVRRIRIFMIVVESGGFSAAQQRLGLSSSSISLHMSALEDRLGTVLCKRGRSGFHLTPEGRRIYQAAEDLMLAHQQFRSAVSEAKGELSGDLRLGVIDNSVFDEELRIPSLLSNFKELAPNVQISLFTMSPSELELAVLNSKLHLAIGVFYERSPILDYRPLCHENLLLYCGRTHPLFKMDDSILNLSHLNSCEFVERTYGTTLDHINVPIDIETVAYTSSLEAALLLILSGQYVGFLPRYYAKAWEDQNLIKVLFPQEIRIETEVCVMVHKYPENSMITNTLLDLIFKK